MEERKENNQIEDKRNLDRDSPTSILTQLPVFDKNHDSVLPSLLPNLSHETQDALSGIFQSMKDDRNALQDRIRELESQVSHLHVQKSKIVANLKSKKSDLSECQKSLQKVLEQNGDLRRGLERLQEARDALKTKLCVKRECLREAYDSKAELSRDLKKLQSEREMERELLDLYRELGRHTGYHNYGKQIRVLESKLEDTKQKECE